MINPTELAEMMGQYPPTAQQAAVIGAEPGPMLVVAGAGAGKTETMASRVVWLVANGYVRPEEVLGLTFTVKAARELRDRIRLRLMSLREAPDFRAVANPAVLESLEEIAPKAMTYDAYAGQLVRDYGLLLPTEPTAEIIDQTTLWGIARDYLAAQPDFDMDASLDDAVAKLLDLSDAVDSALADVDEVTTETKATIANIENTPKGPRQKKDLHSDLEKPLAVQNQRLSLLSKVERLEKLLDDRGVRTFSRQMALAAELARSVPEVGERERRAHRIIMFDEYQDTSHVQRLLLRNLFGGCAVTAVGDPMQSIYGWRGATEANLTGFHADFPQSDGSPAPTLQLTISWRNPGEVLDAANVITDEAYAGRPRDVEPLQPRPGAGAGRVEFAHHATQREEFAWIADHMAAAYRDARAAGEPFSAAVLLRGNKDAPAVLEALAARDVPGVIVTSVGLLSVPEVAETLAYLHALAEPADNESMLRLLAGPRWQLGAADIAALGRRGRKLARRERPTQHPDAYVNLLGEVAEAVADIENPPMGLGFAVDDPGPEEDYSPEGYARIRALGGRLDHLRRLTPAPPLPDLVAEVMEVFGIRAEAAAGAATAGTVHLDRFTEIAASYSRRVGDDLAGFLGWLAIAEEADKGLELGDVPMRRDHVDILTVHKAKGLEWATVAVAGVTEDNYGSLSGNAGGGHTLPNWIRSVEKLPLPDDEGATLDTASAATQGDLVKELKAFDEGTRADGRDEARRLLYVALTRSKDTLLVSSSAFAAAGTKKPKAPAAQLVKLTERFPDAVDTWTAPEDVAVNPLTEELEASGGTAWPADPLGSRRAEVEEAARLVRAAMDGDVAEPLERDISGVWAEDVGLVLEELAAADHVVEVPAPRQLSVSEYRSALSDPKAYARRLARPVPFKPNRFARRGTTFHAWLESRWSGGVLIDDDELAEIAGGMDPIDQPELERLREAFEASEWAGRTPASVEASFDIGIEGVRVVGRIDAVFRIDGQWVVMDWKTGRQPKGAEARRAALQLAVYRIAWADRCRARGEDVAPGDVRAMFHYVRTGETVEPAERDLPDRIQLAEELRGLIREPGSGGAEESRAKD